MTTKHLTTFICFIWLLVYAVFAHAIIPHATDWSTAPIPKWGIDYQNTTTGAPPGTPTANNTGQARFEIVYAGVTCNDAVTKWGIPCGSQHAHYVFTNREIAVNTWPNLDDLQENCRAVSDGGTVNCSGYWVPIVKDAITGAIVPVVECNDCNLIYYKTDGAVSPTNLITKPQLGQRMAAGNQTYTDTNHPTQNPSKISIQCEKPDGSTLPSQRTIGPCPQGGKVHFTMTYNNCVKNDANGNMMKDGTDTLHLNHLAYTNNQAICPAGYTRTVGMTIKYMLAVTAPEGTLNWTVDSDMYDFVPGAYQAGWSLHARAVLGWVDWAMESIINNCLNAKLDCGAHNLGEGTKLLAAP